MLQVWFCCCQLIQFKLRHADHFFVGLRLQQLLKTDLFFLIFLQRPDGLHDWLEISVFL